MGGIIWFCLFCWLAGGVFLAASFFNWRLSHIRYLSESETGKTISRILTGGFGAVLFAIGLLVFMSPW